MSESQLIQTAIRSSKWALIARISQVSGRAVMMILLPLWLASDDFGMITMFTSVLALVVVLQQAGLIETVIQREQGIEDVRQAALWLGVVISIFLYGVLFFSAPLFSIFFREPRLVGALRLAGLQILMSGISNIPLAWLQRTFRYKLYALIQFFSATLMVAVAVLFAVLGYGYRAYILGVLSGTLSILILAILFLEWRPTFKFHFHWWGEIFKFSGFVLLEMIFGWFFVYFDNVTVAKNLGSEAAGMYSLAFYIATMSIAIPVSAISGVTLATFSRLQGDVEKLRDAYFQGTRLIAAYALPTSFGLSLLGPTIFRIVYPDRWEGLGVLLSILSLYAGFGHLWALNSDAFKAIGRPELMVKIYAPVFFVMIPFYWWSSLYGLIPFVITRSLIVLVSALPHTYFAIRYLNLKNNYLLQILKAPLVASSMMAVSVWTLISLGSSRIPTGHWMLYFLAVVVAIGAGVYWLALKILSPDLLWQIGRLFRKVTQGAGTP